jgi:NhaP-type Na+/H+ or K+/H+ antiporter
MLSFLESEGQLLMLLVFLGLGASLAVPAIRAADPSMLAYAALSLTLVRMLPTSLCLLGSGLRPASHLFLGWFGPRGLASVLYAVLLLSEASLPNEAVVFAIIVLTVLASTCLHGLSAAPAARAFGRRMNNREACPAEHAPVTPHPTR